VTAAEGFVMPRKLLFGCALAALALVYWFPTRRWFGRWGTTEEERTRLMPGDNIIANPTLVGTGAVTVEAPPEDIWPWLVQLGTGRGGLYSYDWLDRLFGFLDRPSANEILPEFQQLAVGDSIRFGGDELIVKFLDPLRSLVLLDTGHGMQWVWQFGLYPVDATRTRLVERGTQWIPNTVVARLGLAIIEPAGFIMTRRFLLGVKERAERLRESRNSN
jgi:hypothetical protein